MIIQGWTYSPEQAGACKWFFWRNDRCVAWVCLTSEGYDVDSWPKPPPPHGPYKTLEEAQLVAEFIYA